MRALVVDDSSTIRHIIRVVLADRFDFEVVEAADAVQAMEAVGPFDLVVTDLLMPGPHGNSLIQHLCRSEGAPTPKILVVSVETHPGVSKSALDAGADAFLGKPFHVEDLARQIRSLFPS